MPQSILAPLDLETAFGRAARLEVDLGCGDGSFLVALAEQNPDANFIGVERLVGRVRSACRKIGARCLTNARIVQVDILHAAQHFFAPRSVDAFYLMFPDPWPKRRHSNRRIVNESFLRAVHRALKPGGELRIAPDHADYFAAIQAARSGSPLFVTSSIDHSLGQPLTTFEKQFRAAGTEIHRLVLRKVSARK
ncbi:MAG: tRNA (guanosine(46)-N7)-methyltransferase TrmB [Chthoniobacterales bacterium]